MSSGEWIIIPVCPEQLAGLPTPRPESRFQSGDGDSVLTGTGKVKNVRQEDMTDVFIKGAEQVLRISEMNLCSHALLKERSPSCGVRQIYGENGLTNGNGVTTALLRKNEISVYSEEELEDLTKERDRRTS